jgi:AraC-like DNA-binding protein
MLAPCRPLNCSGFASTSCLTFTAELRLADLAAEIPLSPHHFARAFRAATGTTPHAYVVGQRLQAACTRLRRTTQNIEDVAQATGFTDRSHLAHHLRARHGLSPTAYRHQTRR